MLRCGFKPKISPRGVCDLVLTWLYGEVLSRAPSKQFTGWFTNQDNWNLGPESFIMLRGLNSITNMCEVPRPWKEMEYATRDA